MESIKSEKIKFNIARLKKAGQIFEINVDPDLAVKFKKGELTNLREVLKAEQIFSDTKKGEMASETQLQETFKTTDPLQIAEIIIKQGEIQLTSEFRSEEREKKKKQILDIINKNAINPTTKLPHPLQRLELAFDEAKVQINEHQSAEEQVDHILDQLRPILPIKFEQSTLKLTIPATHAAKSYSLVQRYSKILKESWNPDGSWTATIELPAGLKPDFLDKLNSQTHGGITVEEKES